MNIDKDIEIVKEIVIKSRDLREEEFYKLIGIHNIQSIATVLNLIEKLRIKNGKEFARGMETNEKLWRAKIKAMQDEYFEKVKIYNCDTADWKQSQDMGSYVVLGRLLKGE